MFKVIQVPDEFMINTNHEYPPHNTKVFEEFFFEEFIKYAPELDRWFLPIQWTCYYISKNYATEDISRLQTFLDELPRDLKYFTIIQWDDGIMNNVDHLDLKIFASGGVGDYPIPLINLSTPRVDKSRDIFASFLGVIGGRHKIREEMHNVLKYNPKYTIRDRSSFEEFKDTMERSIFALCPRGYGKTSFRINESLNFGAIPVYIFDDPWIPFEDELDFTKYGVLIPQSEINNIDNILSKFTDVDLFNFRHNGRIVYDEYYTYSSCYDKIITKI